MTTGKAARRSLPPGGEPGSELNEVVTDAVRALFGRDSLYTVVWAVQLVAAAAVTPLMTRQLDAPNFGRVAAAIAVMQVFFVVSGCGMYLAIQRHYAQPDGQGQAAKVMTLSIAVSALVTV